MTFFQWLFIPVLASIFLWDLSGWLRTVTRLNIRFARCLVWLAAIIAILDPRLTQYLAELLGIGRGTDVLLYFFILAFLLSSFYLYARYVSLQKQITLLVRYIALASPQRGEEGP